MNPAFDDEESKLTMYYRLINRLFESMSVQVFTQNFACGLGFGGNETIKPRLHQQIKCQWKASFARSTRNTLL